MSFFLDAARVALLEDRVAAEDRNGYFSLLAEWGDPYAVLALEVVNHSGFSGRMANVFMAESALAVGKVADEASAQAVGIRIITRDFQYRLADLDASGEGLLDNRQIERYHKDAFEDKGITVDFWTAHKPLKIAEDNWQALADFLVLAGETGWPVGQVTDAESARAHVWSKMIDGSLMAAVSTGAYAALMEFFALYDPEWTEKVTRYAVDESDYIMLGFGSPFPPDPYGLFADTLSLENIIKSNLLGTGYSIDAGYGNDVVLGSGFRDTLMGGGNDDLIIAGVHGTDGDTLEGGFGDDLLIGSVGSDSIKGDIGDDYILGLAGDDILEGGTGADTFSFDEGHSGAMQIMDFENSFLFSADTLEFHVSLLFDSLFTYQRYLAFQSHMKGSQSGAGTYQDWIDAGYTGDLAHDLATPGVLQVATQANGGVLLSFKNANPNNPQDFSSVLLVGVLLNTFMSSTIEVRTDGLLDSLAEGLDGMSVQGTDLITFIQDAFQQGLSVTMDGFTTPVVDGTGGQDSYFVRTGTGRVNGLGENDILTAGVWNADRTALVFETPFSTLASLGLTFDGGAGNDALTGSRGNDTLYGGDDDDTILTNGGRDMVYGGAGNDFAHAAIIGVDAPPTGTTGVASASGSNATGATDPVHTLDGGDGHDTLWGSADAEHFIGGTGNDILISGGGSDLLEGGDGADVLTVALIQDLDEDGHFDTAAPGSLAEAMVALFGGAGNDTLNGGALADTLDGGTGADIMNGGAGNDIYTVDHASDVVDETNSNGGDSGGVDTVHSLVSWTLGDHVEHLTLLDAPAGATSPLHTHGTGNALGNTLTGNAGHNTLLGEAGNDSLVGGAGDDTLHGGDGDDTIRGGTGFDHLYGGLGNDVLDGSSDATGFQVTITGGMGDDTIQGSRGSDDLFGDEGHDSIIGSTGQDDIFGGVGNDTVNGQGSNDRIEGNDGLDLLFGGSGNDSLWGGVDHDTLWGETGLDTLTGDAGNDLAYGGDDADLLFGGVGLDTLWGDAGLDTLHGDDGNDVLDGGADNDALFGGLGTDSLLGGAGFDALTGDDGNDTLDGGTENDTLWGSAGADSLTGGTGNDSLDGGEGSDTLWGQVGNDTLLGGGGNDTLDGGDWADTLDGGIGADALFGGQSNDVLVGGDGGDTLSGGTGNDQMTGGLGADRFLFAANGGSDTVLDFQRAQADKIVFEVGAFAAGTTTAQILATWTTVSASWTTIALENGGSVRIDGVTDLVAADLMFA